jgi:two-component system sensor histidine kinase SenX3
MFTIPSEGVHLLFAWRSFHCRAGAYDGAVDATAQALLLGLLGLLLGIGVTLAWRISDRQLGARPEAEELAVPPGVATVLAVLPSSALVIGEDGAVLQASAPAYALGLVRGNSLYAEELVDLVRQVRRNGEIKQAELEVPRADGGTPFTVSARVAPLGSRLVLVLVEDRTRERLVEAIRRDFVANVSHELKTPVGAIELLAEAVLEASGDPEAVERFAGRMKLESGRLSRLVQQIIELSRLQSDDPLETPAPTAVDTVVQRALAQSATDAEAREVSLVRRGDPGLLVLGNADQLTVALGNLVANAVAYSPPGATVTVTTGINGALVDLEVADQGIGIPAAELDRIFERFYRVDPARHRSTGGTGLGLSIVKHVAASYGGTVRVASVEGRGSAFTLSLPGRPLEPRTATARSPLGVSP